MKLAYMFLILIVLSVSFFISIKIHAPSHKTTTESTDKTGAELTDTYEILNPSELSFTLKGFNQISSVDPNGNAKTIGGNVDELLCEGKNVELTKKSFEGEYLVTKDFSKIKIQFGKKINDSGLYNPAGFSVWLTQKQKEQFKKEYKANN